jgi:hypothetical protein
MGGTCWIITVYGVYSLWVMGIMYVVCVYIVGGGLLRIPDIFRTAGFVLICDLVVSEKLRIFIIKNHKCSFCMVFLC